MRYRERALLLLLLLAPVEGVMPPLPYADNDNFETFGGLKRMGEVMDGGACGRVPPLLLRLLPRPLLVYVNY